MRATAAAQVPSIHLRLRSQTAGLHHELERELSFLLGKELSLDRYRRLLGAFYGFYAPLERELAALAAFGPKLGVPLRARARWLEDDLGVLGLSPSGIAALPRCVELPELEQPAHLAGAFYVVEGACLGGQILCRAVERRLALRADHGASFFAGDGSLTASRWEQVLAWLEDFAGTNRLGDEISTGACRTFAALFHWLRDQRVTE